MTRLWWIKHFIDSHTFRVSLGGEDMMKYDKAFLQAYNDHKDLHIHFYTGHEHTEDGSVIPGRTK